jgi:adenylate cyclase
MPTEIERKFLVTSDAWRAEARACKRYRQGYLPTDPSCSVRVRTAGERAYLNIKSGTLDVTRQEYEYPIPLAEAEELLDSLCRKPLIEKVRHFVEVGDHTWEVDEFEGDNRGLIVAEVELGHPDEAFRRPAWLGEEVSDDPRYYNVCLVDHPYKDWA